MDNDDIFFNKIKNKINIKKKEHYNSIILKIIDIVDPQIRKKKYNNEYYLNMILHLLDSIVNWKNLMLLTPNNKKYHYKTIYNKFTKWSNLNVFKYAFKIYNSLNYIKINHKILDLFIDCTYISNTRGVENVGYNPEYKKKKATKISCLCDKNKNIVSISACKMSTIHDIKTVPETLKNIIIDTGNKKINIIGDKGYVNSSIFLYDNKIVNTIVPNRKNMKKRSSQYNKTKLKKRYLIENVFAELKKFNRIKNRKEKNIENFMSFIYIACMVRIIL